METKNHSDKTKFSWKNINIPRKYKIFLKKYTNSLIKKQEFLKKTMLFSDFKRKNNGVSETETQNGNTSEKKITKYRAFSKVFPLFPLFPQKTHAYVRKNTKNKFTNLPHVRGKTPETPETPETVNYSVRFQIFKNGNSPETAGNSKKMAEHSDNKGKAAEDINE